MASHALRKRKTKASRLDVLYGSSVAHTLFLLMLKIDISMLHKVLGTKLLLSLSKEKGIKMKQLSTCFGRNEASKVPC